VQQPPPATFRFIISPFVEWIWLGGLIAAGGALLALWPAGSARRRRVRVPRPIAVGLASNAVTETGTR
jgi:cytochrome c-type biogenesis protein CcmF